MNGALAENTPTATSAHYNCVDGHSKRTITLGRTNNAATISLAPGYRSYHAFCCEADLEDPHENDPIALPAGIISDHEPDDDVRKAESPSNSSSRWIAEDGDDDTPIPTTPTTIDFDLNGPPQTASEGEGTASVTSTTNVIINEEDMQPSDLAEILTLHHQHAHISMRKLQEMAKQGVIPKRLSKCRIPTCSACLYSKATKRSWRGKPQNEEKREKLCNARPCQVVSVDQLVSPTPGLIAQMTGFFTTKRYKYATVMSISAVDMALCTCKKRPQPRKLWRENEHLRHSPKDKGLESKTTTPTTASSRLEDGSTTVSRRDKG
jgi:hypothetical protein